MKEEKKKNALFVEKQNLKDIIVLGVIKKNGKKI